MMAGTSMQPITDPDQVFFTVAISPEVCIQHRILSLSYINPYDIFYFIRSSVFDLLRGNFLLNNNNLILCLLVSLRSISPKRKIHCNCFELNAALRTVNAIVEEYN